MYYNSVPISTLYFKANFKRTPYKNDAVSFRIVAHTFAEFTSNKALFLVDLNPDTVSLAEVNFVAESLRIKANALNVKLKMPDVAYKKLLKRDVA